MKLGIIISVIIVVVLLFIGLVTMSGVPDSPTKATAPDKLKKQLMPTTLTPVFEPADPEASVNDAVSKVFRYYNQNTKAFKKTEPPGDVVKGLVDLLERAMNAGVTTTPFLDNDIPMEPGAEPSFRDALEAAPAAALAQAQKIGKDGEKDAAKRIARSVWALGQRCFEHGSRLYVRWTGLQIMTGAGAVMVETEAMTDQEMQNLRAWAGAVQSIQNAWSPKVQMIWNVKPQIGDLLNIAKNDEDLTFRVAATLQLGVAKFNSGHKRNLTAIEELIAKSKTNDDRMIAAAAAAADAFTKESLHKMR